VWLAVDISATSANEGFSASPKIVKMPMAAMRAGATIRATGQQAAASSRLVGYAQASSEAACSDCSLPGFVMVRRRYARRILIAI
jgi:hypothetical protein